VDRESLVGRPWMPSLGRKIKLNKHKMLQFVQRIAVSVPLVATTIFCARTYTHTFLLVHRNISKTKKLVAQSKLQNPWANHMTVE